MAPLLNQIRTRTLTGGCITVYLHRKITPYVQVCSVSTQPGCAVDGLSANHTSVKGGQQCVHPTGWLGFSKLISV